MQPSESPLTIRRFTPTDLPRVAEIAEADRFALDYVSPRGLLRLRRKCRERFFVAEIAGKIVGFMVTCIEPRKRYLRAHVIALAVDSAFRRRGIGKALAEYTLTTLDNPAIAVYEAEIRTDNVASISLAESYGFQRADVKPHFYSGCADALS